MIIVKLVDVSWDMWEHRNGIRHAPHNPRYIKAITELDSVLEEELTCGRGILLESEWHYFDVSLASLLGKTLVVKTAWLNNIEAARTYAEGHRLGIASKDVGYRKERKALRQWLQTGFGI
jgi:hypothetical protein